MERTTSSSSSSSSRSNSPPPSPSLERLTQKLAQSNLNTPQNPTLNWEDSRLFTPGETFGLKTPIGIKFDKEKIKLFISEGDSQGLLLEEKRVVGGSVTTTIKNENVRKEEKKKTFIQYDKCRVDQTGKDFEVSTENRNRKVNYQGGHLIDYKYSAEESHITEMNYIPQHYFYNAPLKEYLVQQSNAFIEIPLYTPNPPTIGVKSQSKNFHPIPIGIVFVQIKENAIKGVYYFPNNKFDYEGLKEKIGVVKTISEAMLPHFKLKPSFHAFFKPALITDFKQTPEEKSKQSYNEKIFSELMLKISNGMKLYNKGKVDPRSCLDCNDNQWENIQNEPLEAPFAALGQFLVKYRIRNALKSEVISINSRLQFIDVVIDFIENYDQFSDEALDFIDSLAEEFYSCLGELNDIEDTMNQEELLFYADAYRRISSHFNLAFSAENRAIFFDDVEKFFEEYIDVLELLVSKYPIVKLEGCFLEFVQDAQATLDYYLIECGYPEKDFLEVAKFLKSLRIPLNRANLGFSESDSDSE